MPDEMVTLTIDDQEVTVPKGTVILEAAKKVGIDIPIFCYHPKLKPFGACRMCLVEIEKVPKPQTACTVPVSQGMIVRTKTPPVVKARKAMLEFLLINHPLDCPVCDKGGECDLQDLTFDHGPGETRFFDKKRHFKKPLHLSNFITLDMERCILCKRCIRFCEEIAGDHVIEFFARGADTELSTFVGGSFDSKFSGNTIEICPVGALTDRLFRFSARVWEYNNVPSVCPYCAVGCNLKLQVRNNDILRVFGRENLPVNDQWLCDKGRFGHEFVNSPARLRNPMIKKGDAFEEVSWDEALSFIAGRLQNVKEKYGPDAIGGIGSTRVTNEDAYVFQKFLRTVVGTNNIDHRIGLTRMTPDNDLTRTLSRGAMAVSIEEIEKAKVIFLLGSDVVEELPILALRVRKAVVENGAILIAANPKAIEYDRYAAHKLHYAPGTEAALLGSLAKAILDAGLENKPYIEANTEGLADFAQSLTADAATLTGIPAETLEAAARAVAGGEKVLFLYGRRILNHPGRGDCVRALENLALLTGQMAGESAGVSALVTHNNSQGAVDMGLLPGFYTGYRSLEDASVRSSLESALGQPLPGGRGMNTEEMLEAAHSGRLKALYIAGANLLAHYPDRKWAEESLGSLKLLVVQELFLTETAALADVVLPAASFAEKDGTFTNIERRVQRVRKALELPESLPADWQLVAAVARKMNVRMGFTDAESVLEEIARVTPDYAGLSFGQIGLLGLRRPFGLPEDRLQFQQVRYRAPEGGDQPEYPFTLVPATLLFNMGTITRHNEFMKKVVPDPYVEMHPADARMLGLGPGDTAKVASPYGQLELRVRLTRRCPRSVVVVPEEMESAPLRALTDRGTEIIKVKVGK
ncbi:MAG: NADH-quinone oxidoreductase subunit NuoG [Armatimonadetes bacterium]|nr:NADH-quinone oxidoreductase subunit NuoG [Armatimonadota bacterium]